MVDNPEPFQRRTVDMKTVMDHFAATLLLASTTEKYNIFGNRHNALTCIFRRRGTPEWAALTWLATGIGSATKQAA